MNNLSYGAGFPRCFWLETNGSPSQKATEQIKKPNQKPPCTNTHTWLTMIKQSHSEKFCYLLVKGMPSHSWELQCVEHQRANLWVQPYIPWMQITPASSRPLHFPPLLSSKACTGYPSHLIWFFTFLTKQNKKTEVLFTCSLHTEITSRFWITAMKRWEQPGFASVLRSLWLSLVPEGSGKRLHTPTCCCSSLPLLQY